MGTFRPCGGGENLAETIRWGTETISANRNWELKWALQLMLSHSDHVVGLKKYFFQPLYHVWKGLGNAYELTSGEQRTSKDFSKSSRSTQTFGPCWCLWPMVSFTCLSFCTPSAHTSIIPTKTKHFLSDTHNALTQTWSLLSDSWKAQRSKNLPNSRFLSKPQLMKDLIWLALDSLDAFLRSISIHPTPAAVLGCLGPSGFCSFTKQWTQTLW